VRTELRKRGEAIERELSPRARELVSIIHRMGVQVPSMSDKLCMLYGKSRSALRSKLKELENMGIVKGGVDHQGRVHYSLSPELSAFHSMRKEQYKTSEKPLQVETDSGRTKHEAVSALFGPIHYKIIRVLSEEGSAYVSELRRRLNLRASSIYNGLRALEEAGIVESSLVLMNPGSRTQIAVKKFFLTGELRDTILKLLTEFEN